MTSLRDEEIDEIHSKIDELEKVFDEFELKNLQCKNLKTVTEKTT